MKPRNAQRIEDTASMMTVIRCQNHVYLLSARLMYLWPKLHSRCAIRLNTLCRVVNLEHPSFEVLEIRHHRTPWLSAYVVLEIVVIEDM